MTWDTEAAWILNTSCQGWTAVLGILELFPFTRCVLTQGAAITSDPKSRNSRDRKQVVREGRS